MAPPEPKRPGPGPQFEPLDPPKVTRPPRPGQRVQPQPRQSTPPPKPAVAAKPPQNAVAITYKDKGQVGLPKVVAKGRGLVAEQIIARAREHGVAVHESKELVALLMQVELDDHIPPALYRAVAELLAWLYHIETARRERSKV